jgi:hypothetical protein
MTTKAILSAKLQTLVTKTRTSWRRGDAKNRKKLKGTKKSGDISGL